MSSKGVMDPAIAQQQAMPQATAIMQPSVEAAVSTSTTAVSSEKGKESASTTLAPRNIFSVFISAVLAPFAHPFNTRSPNIPIRWQLRHLLISTSAVTLPWIVTSKDERTIFRFVHSFTLFIFAYGQAYFVISEAEWRCALHKTVKHPCFGIGQLSCYHAAMFFMFSVVVSFVVGMFLDRKWTEEMVFIGIEWFFETPRLGPRMWIGLFLEVIVLMGPVYALSLWLSGIIAGELENLQFGTWMVA